MKYKNNKKLNEDNSYEIRFLLQISSIHKMVCICAQLRITRFPF